MKWEERCMLELTHRNAFENEPHRLRFRDLLICYCSAPFFTKGLCKCMFLNAYTEEQFFLLLDGLNSMTLENSKDLKFMEDSLRYRLTTDGLHNVSERPYLELSLSFLNDTPYQIPDIGVEDPEGAHVIRLSLRAAEYIDELPPLGQ